MSIFPNLLLSIFNYIRIVATNFGVLVIDCKLGCLFDITIIDWTGAVGNRKKETN